MKLATQVLESLKAYNGKVNNHNTELGDTSFTNDHWHKTMIDAKGNGETIKVMPNQEDEEKGNKGHSHKIVNWEVKSAEGHTHEVIS